MQEYAFGCPETAFSPPGPAHHIDLPHLPHVQVGNWVGSGRWAYVDLTAGGFDWGPALGGDGVVHRHTMPSVLDRFSALHSLRSGVLL